MAHSRRAYAISKRLLDMLVSGTLLIAMAPLCLVVALMIKMDSRGPIFFVQNAVGLNGREFRLIKFRSMRPGSQDILHRNDIASNMKQRAPTTYDAQGQPIFKTALAERNRITRIGRILRITSLDELPQLWNVFLGEMSLVGPRPSLPGEVELYEGWEWERCNVKPGMTGLYQVTARNRVPVEEMIRIDLEYARRCSLWFDLKLLAQTPIAMFKGM